MDNQSGWITFGVTCLLGGGLRALIREDGLRGAARLATACAMRPNPMRPRVFPATRRVGIYTRVCHFPSRGTAVHGQKVP